MTAIVQATLPPIPSATLLYPAAVACGDRGSAAKLRHILEKNHLRQNDGMVYLQLPRNFNVGSNANMALGLALENGSNLRHLVQRPLPREYFHGPLIDDVYPPSTVVSEAYRDGDTLVVSLAAAKASRLTLRNVSGIREIRGLSADQWIYEKNILHIKTPGFITIHIVFTENSQGGAEVLTQ